MTIAPRDDPAFWLPDLAEAIRTGMPIEFSRSGSIFEPYLGIPGDAVRAALLNAGRPGDPRGLRIIGATITGSVNLDHFDLKIPVALVDCRIEGVVSFSGAGLKSLDLGGTVCDGVNMNLATVGGTVRANRLKIGKGLFEAVGARIDGELLMNRVEVASHFGIALNLSSAVVGGNFELSSAKIRGSVGMSGATIGGSFLLAGARLCGDHEYSLVMPGARVHGSMDAVGITAYRSINASRTTIGGALLLRRADIRYTAAGHDERQGAERSEQLASTGAGQDVVVALNLRRAGVDEVQLSGCKVRGCIDATGILVKGMLILDEASVVSGSSDENAEAVRLLKADIAALVINMPVEVRGVLNLTRATLGDLQFECSAPPGALVADGWKIGDLHGPIRNDRHVAVEWLETTPLDMFTAQPWREVGVVYERNGRPADARFMKYEAARRAARTLRWHERFVPFLYKSTVGYGYLPFRAAAWLFATLFATVLFVNGTEAYFVPIDVGTAQTAAEKYAAAHATVPPARVTADTPCDQIQPYPCLNPLIFSVNNAIPAAAPSVRPDWIVGSESPAFVALTLGGLRILSWIFVALFLAGVTGLLRKE